MAMTWAEQDLDSYIRDEEDYEARLPICDRCGDPIQVDDDCYLLDGEKMHWDCAMDWLEEHKITVELD